MPKRKPIISLKMDFKKLDKLVRVYKKAPLVYEAAMTNAIVDILLLGESEAKKFVPRNTGHLARSIGIRKRIRSRKPSTGFVGTNLHYAPYVEYGTSPHKRREGTVGFHESIKKWAKQRGIPDAWFPIVKSIQRKGTKPQPFIGPAYDLMSRRSRGILKREFRKATRAIRKATK